MCLNQHFSYYQPKFQCILLKRRPYKCVYQESAKPQRLLPEKNNLFFFFLDDDTVWDITTVVS